MKLSEVDIVLFDLDGTVYYGSKIIDGANETIEFFRNSNKKIFFTTNNSTKTREQIFKKLVGLGVNCKLDEVLTSGYLAALFALKKELEDIYIFGSDNLIDEFENMGIKVNQTDSAKNLLIGYDPAMTYEGLTNAVQIALHAKYIIACNKEKLYPGENKRLMPGCGAMTAPVEWCAGRTCDYIIGKPNTLALELLSQQEHIQADHFLVVGDSYQSDIVMAKNFGAKAIHIANEKHPDVITVNSIKDVPSLF